MSNQAITWATQQRTGRSVIKFLLVAIANYCDEQGKCWPSQKRLAEDTEMSVDSVQRHLRELERLGLVYRTPRRYDSGQRAADYVILLMNDEARDFAAVHGWSEQKPGEIDTDDSLCEENDPERDEDDEAKAADCGVGFDASQGRNQPEPKPQLCGLHTKDEPSKNPQINPLPPSVGAVREEGSADEGAETKVRAPQPSVRKWEDDAAAFEAVWPFERDEPREPCRRWMRNAAPDLRPKVIEAAKAYLADVKRRNAKRCSAKRFLRDKVFEGFVSGVPKAVNRVFVRQGSDAWNAWAATRATSWPTTDHRDEQGRIQRGWWFPTLFPPPSSARDGPQAA